MDFRILFESKCRLDRLFANRTEVLKLINDKHNNEQLFIHLDTVPGRRKSIISFAQCHRSQQPLLHSMRIIKIAIILTLYMLTSCKNSNQHTWSELPQVTNISKLRQTQFVPTLENSITGNKNIIYAPTFLYAWKKVKQKLKAPINLTNDNSNEFKLLNQSTSFKNTLTDDEYSAEAEIVDSIIRAKAFFNKTLPFQSKLQRLDNPILFNKTKVMAFGMQSYDEEAVKFTKILYYKDDDHFIIKLILKDNADEIQLVKGVTDVVSLSDAIKKINRLIDVGNREKSNTTISWKYSLNDIDIFSIPNIKLNSTLKATTMQLKDKPSQQTVKNIM